MPDRPTARQRDAWLLAAMTVPAVALCAGIGWQWALLGGAISAALYLIQGRARQSGLALRDAVNEAFGTAGGTMIMVLAAIWNLFALAWLTQRADGAFPEAKDSVAVGLILLALAAFAAWKGEDVAARCAGVIALVLVGLYVLLLLAAIGDVELEWLRPWGGWRRALLPMGCLLLPCAAWYLGAEKDESGGKGHWALLLLAPALAAAVTAGCLSPRLAAMADAPFYGGRAVRAAGVCSAGAGIFLRDVAVALRGTRMLRRETRAVAARGDGCAGRSGQFLGGARSGRGFCGRRGYIL